MHTGILNLFCPICGKRFRYDQNIPLEFYHDREFGIICSRPCFLAGQTKYAEMILGNDEAPDDGVTPG